MNQLFDTGREGILDHSIDMTGATIKAALVDSYAFDATDKFLSDLVAGGGHVAATVALAGKTYAAGVLDATDLTWGDVPNGPDCNAIVLYNDTGAAGTSRLVAFIDSAGGSLPVTPNGGELACTWDAGANRIFKL